MFCQLHGLIMRNKIGTLMTTKEGIFISSGTTELWEGAGSLSDQLPSLSWSTPNAAWCYTSLYTQGNSPNRLRENPSNPALLTSTWLLCPYWFAARTVHWIQAIWEAPPSSKCPSHMLPIVAEEPQLKHFSTSCIMGAPGPQSSDN